MLGAAKPRIGLALAGGGPEGAIYEIGAVRALEEAVEGLDLNAVDMYVGVSAGSFIAACLANGMTTGQLCRAIVKHDPQEHPFVPETFFTPAASEWLRRGLSTPRLALEALRDYMANPADQTLLESFTRLSRALPVGLFDNEPIRHYLQRIFSIRGRTDDFRELSRRLFIIAADLDSGQAVCFGEPPFDDVPISRAIQASTALPGLYPPVEIGGRYYLDGVLLKTLHSSVALDAGAELLLCVNPIVPVDTEDSVAAGVMRRGRLIHRGLPTVLSQTFRTLVHSRLTVGMSRYSDQYPNADVVLFEPGRDDFRMFFTNIFSFSDRRRVCEHAYLSVRRQLLERKDELRPLLERHGLRLRAHLLAEERDVWTEVGFPEQSRRPPGSRLTQDLERALSRLEELLADAEQPSPEPAMADSQS